MNEDQQAVKTDAPADDRPDAKDADPGKIARQFMDEHSIAGVLCYRYWDGTWLWWSFGCYSELTEPQVRADVLRFIDRQWKKVKCEHVRNVIEHLKAHSALPPGTSPPAWIGKQPQGFPAHECLATSKQVVHLPSWVDKATNNSVPASPSFFTLSASQFDIEQPAPEPKCWLEFLDQLWPDDPESIATLQEMFGYLLTGDTRQQKIFFLVGRPRCGKGTIIKILSKLIGNNYVASPTLSSLSGQFGSAPLVGKTLAAICDARLNNRTDVAAVLAQLLSISGEDPQTIDRKHLPAIHCRLGVRFLIASNELPQLTDASGAIVTRLILLRIKQSFLGKEDMQLERKLTAELHGILIWAIDGWKRLRARGHFVQPAAGKQLLESMRELSSPISGFVNDCCDLGKDHFCPKQDLFPAFQKWCEEQNIKRIPTKSQFTRDLNAAHPEINANARPRINNDPSRPRGYLGIRLKVAATDDLEF